MFAPRPATPGHLGLIAMLVDPKLKGDRTKRQILGDDETGKFPARDSRALRAMPSRPRRLA